MEQLIYICWSLRDPQSEPAYICLCSVQTRIDWHRECPVHSAPTRVGILQSHQPLIASPLFNLSAVNPRENPLDEEYRDIAGQIFVVVLDAANRDAILSWQMACAGHLIIPL